MPKVSLRLAEETDAKFVYEIMQDKEYQKHYLERLIPKSIIDAENEIRRAKRGSEKNQQFYFIILFGKESAGVIDIYKASLSDKRASIGYGVKKEFWEKGIATKATKLGLAFMKQKGFHTCEATVDPKNKASKIVLTKNGFKLVGTLKDYYFDKGKFVDRELYWKIL
ncbi:MAG: GNAT family N-acetyltransferase [archaeon]|jgi:ribosomal-protein-alanine N-acetyltransferase